MFESFPSRGVFKTSHECDQNEPYISRLQLSFDLSKAHTKCRDTTIYLSFGLLFLEMILAYILLPEMRDPKSLDKTWFQPVCALLIFGQPILIYFLYASRIARRRVVCHQCQGSLWDCGESHHKRIQVRDDVTACPHCGIPIS